MDNNRQQISCLNKYQRLMSSNKIKINQLKQLLANNLQIQRSLKEYRDNIQERMQAIDEYITTYRLKKEFPVDSSLYSYLRYEKKPPQALKDQIIRVQTELLKITDDIQLNKQHKQSSLRKQKKTKPIDLAQLPKNPKIIRFQQLTESSGYSSGIQLYRQWFDFNKTKIPKAPYTLEQQRTIVQLHKKYGNSWQKICNLFEQRSFDDIYYEYHNRLDPNIVNGRWTLRQSLMLIILLQHFQSRSRNWSAIGERMVIKSELQVRQRFCNVIDPDVGRDDYWTPQMERTLMEIAGEYDYCWQKISKVSIFNNKTDNCIWRKFRAIMISKSKEQIKEIIKNNGARGLADKIIKYKEMIESRNRRVSIVENKKFDPNQRARKNRQNLQKAMMQGVDIENQEGQNTKMLSIAFNNKDPSLLHLRDI